MRLPLVIATLWLLGGCGSGGGDPVRLPTNSAPTAQFFVDVSSGEAPLTVSFDATGSADSDGRITLYEWAFGDGSTATGAQLQHTFDAPGSYRVSLTVRDDDSLEASTFRTISVNPAPGTLSVSGKIQILGSSAIDSDVNDRASTPVSNNTFDEAQNLPNPATLGGFINVARSGPPTGVLFTSGDPADFYRISLTGNENILLTIGDSPTIADLDLALYDSDRNFIDASVGIAGTESLAAPGPGEYFVHVYSLLGASNYVLSIGQNLELAAAPRLSSALVPHQALIQHATDLPLSAAATTATPAAHRVPLTEIARSGNLSLANTSVLGNAVSNQAIAGVVDPLANLTDPALRTRYQTLLAIKQLARNPEYECVEPNYLRQSHATPSDQFFDLQWHYNNINLPLAWDISLGSPDVIVAVIDTGVLLDHPDLEGQLVDGFDFISNVGIANDGDGIDADPDDPGDFAQPGASSFHGTHVAGTIAAANDNVPSGDTTGLGVAGASWGSRVMPLRALGVGGGTSFDIMEAAKYAAGLPNVSGTVPPQRADVINMSLGGGAFSQMEQNTFQAIRNQGVIIVASAGNSSTSAPSFPAAYQGVVSVSATTITNSIAPYSNFGPTIEVAAPGGYTATDVNGDGIGDGVVSTLGSDGGNNLVFGYAALQGTSMAAPHVAAVAALMKSVHPELTPVEFDTALSAGALTDDLGPPGRDAGYGFGLINAREAMIEALRLADGTAADPGPVVTTTPNALSLGAFSDEASLTLENVGSGAPRLISATTTEAWLTVAADPLEIDQLGFGRYLIRVDRSQISADGTYTSQVIFDTDANDVAVDVVMQVSSIDLTANAGVHFILLLDAQTNDAIDQVQLSASNGEYQYTFNGVRPGAYRIVAGTDSDDDGFICDDGEACGAYQTLDSPDDLDVADDVTGADFTSGFRFNLSDLGAAANTAESTDANPGNDTGADRQSGYPVRKSSYKDLPQHGSLP